MVSLPCSNYSDSFAFASHVRKSKAREIWSVWAPVHSYTSEISHSLSSLYDSVTELRKKHFGDGG